jgi:hypothetical protein
MGVSDQHHARPHFTSGERTPGTHWTGGWVDPRAGLDAEARREILCPCRGSNSGRPVRSQSLYRLSYRDSEETVIVVQFNKHCDVSTNYSKSTGT